MCKIFYWVPSERPQGGGLTKGKVSLTVSPPLPPPLPTYAYLAKKACEKRAFPVLRQSQSPNNINHLLYFKRSDTVCVYPCVYIETQTEHRAHVQLTCVREKGSTQPWSTLWWERTKTIFLKLFLSACFYNSLFQFPDSPPRPLRGDCPPGDPLPPVRPHLLPRGDEACGRQGNAGVLERGHSAGGHAGKHGERVWEK